MRTLSKAVHIVIVAAAGDAKETAPGGYWIASPVHTDNLVFGSWPHFLPVNCRKSRKSLFSVRSRSSSVFPADEGPVHSSWGALGGEAEYLLWFSVLCAGIALPHLQSIMFSNLSFGFSSPLHCQNLRLQNLDMCVISLRHSNTPWRSYFPTSRGHFVYCPFLLVLFTMDPGIFIFCKFVGICRIPTILSISFFRRFFFCRVAMLFEQAGHISTTHGDEYAPPED